MDCLRNAKRFRATVSFIADTGLQNAAEQGKSVPRTPFTCSLYAHTHGQCTGTTNSCPLNELLSVPDLEQVHEAVILIFGHLNRKLKLSPYPVHRTLPLVETPISRDFSDQLLTSHSLLYTPYETFYRLLAQTVNVFRIWDENLKEFTNVARDLVQKRKERFIPINVTLAHAKLQSGCGI